MVIDLVINPVIGGVTGGVIGGDGGVVLNPELKAWYKVNASGTVITDVNNLITSWKNRRTSFPINDLTSPTGTINDVKIGLFTNNQVSAHFRHDGSNASYAFTADNASLDYTRLTVFAVFEANDLPATSQTIFGKFNTSGNQREFRLGITASTPRRLFFGRSSDGIAETTNSLTGTNSTLVTGKTYIGFARYDGANIRVGLVGIDTPTVTLTQDFAFTGTIFNGTANLQLGTRNTTADPFIGELGEVLFYTKALTDREIAKNINYLRRWFATRTLSGAVTADSNTTTVDSTTITADRT